MMWKVMCKKNDNLSVYGLMLTVIIFKDSVRTAQ
jgi:hypothetical protein